MRPLLAELSEKTFEDYRGRPRRMAYGTLEEWFYKYRHDGFEGLKPLPRSDQGCSRRLSPEIEQLVIDLKREDPGRSAPLILRELELAGRINRENSDAVRYNEAVVKLCPFVIFADIRFLMDIV